MVFLFFPSGSQLFHTSISNLIGKAWEVDLPLGPTASVESGVLDPGPRRAFWPLPLM